MFDIAGIVVLVALIAFFGFLATHAWKAKNALVRWAGVFLCALLTLIPAVVLVLGLIGFAKLNEQHANPVADITVTGNAAQVARGRQLAHICVGCHTTDNNLPLAGTNFAAKFGLPPLGTFYAPNLTPGGNIDDWTDGEVIRAIREGVHKSGRSLLVMPAVDFRKLSDDDVQALVAYLRTQPASGDPTPANRFNLLGALFTNLVDFRTAQPPAGTVTAPPPGTADYGRYMVDILGCQDCHGERLQGKTDSGEPGPPPGPNLTQIVPQWTEEQFMAFFNTGTLPGGATVPTLTLPSGFTEPRMPWSTVRAATTDAELRDMYAYLHSLPPVDGPAH